jgi:hypothetical protein
VSNREGVHVEQEVLDEIQDENVRLLPVTERKETERYDSPSRKDRPRTRDLYQGQIVGSCARVGVHNSGGELILRRGPRRHRLEPATSGFR